jgi:hypothetical protein
VGLPVTGPGLDRTGKILAFAAVVEAGTGLALMIAPGMVVALLLGTAGSGEDPSVGRVAGIALLALGVACWPGAHRVDRDSAPYRAMLVYNLLVALYLAFLGGVGRQAGRLLWPAVVLHAIVALLLIWASRAKHHRIGP